MDKLTRSFFNEIAHKWNNNKADVSQSRLPDIFKQYVNNLNGRILDVGSGAGALVPVFQNYPQIKKIVEMDIAENMLKESKRIHNKVETAHHINASAMNIPAHNESFNHVIAFAVYPHLSSPENALLEFHRILKPDGCLIILHLMGHKELNRMHREAHKTVNGHHLPPANIVAGVVQKTGFHLEEVVEQSDLYLIKAVKKA